jgi:dephospho-CoA kinase
MKIIAFTGMPASGKSEAVQLAKDKGIPVIRMGDMVWEETKKQGKPLDDKNVGDIANSMRQKHGMDIWAKRTVEKIRPLKKSQIIVIDGVRNNEEVEYFKKQLGRDFLLVAIDTSTELRKQRLHNRRRIDDAVTKQSFEERDKRELQWGLQQVIASADIVVTNEVGIDVFKEKIEQIFNQFL